MSNQTQTASVGARIVLLAAVAALAASLLGREPALKRVVTDRLIPSRPAAWTEPDAGGMRIETVVDGGSGVPAVAVRIGDAPLRWEVQARPQSRLRFGYRRRGEAGDGAEPVTVSAVWQSAAGDRTELYRERLQPAKVGPAGDRVEVELPTSGPGEIVLSAELETSPRGAAREAPSDAPELLWLDPIVLAP